MNAFWRAAIEVVPAPAPHDQVVADKGHLWVSMRVRRWALPALAWSAVRWPWKPVAFVWAVWVFWVRREGGGPW